MDAQTGQRNGKRPPWKHRDRDKRGNETPRQGNWLTRNTYRWHNPHCLVHCCGSHGKRMKAKKCYDMLLFSALKCFKTFFLQNWELFNLNPDLTWKATHMSSPWITCFFSSLHVFVGVYVCVWGFCRTLLCLPKSARRQHTKHVAQCSLCVFPLCVCACAFGILCVDRVPGCPRWL